jgi:hypothetical protein
LKASELRREMLYIIWSVELGPVRWSERFTLDFLPVNAFKPRMAHNFFSISFRASKPLVRILLEQLGAKISSVV